MVALYKNLERICRGNHCMGSRALSETIINEHNSVPKLIQNEPIQSGNMMKQNVKPFLEKMNAASSGLKRGETIFCFLMCMEF